MREPFLGTMLRKGIKDVFLMYCRTSRRDCFCGILTFHSSFFSQSYFGSLAPSTSIRSITGGAASRVAAWAISALAIGPLR